MTADSVKTVVGTCAGIRRSSVRGDWWLALANGRHTWWRRAGVAVNSYSDGRSVVRGRDGRTTTMENVARR